MDEILRLLPEILNIDFIRGIISNPRDKTGIIKIRVRPLEKKGGTVFSDRILYKDTGISRESER